MLIAPMKDFPAVIPAVATVNMMTSKPERVLGESALIQTDGNALLKAAWLGRLRLMRLLIEGGTDVNKTNDEGRTALMVACSSTYKDTQSTTKSKIVKFLLENKCDPNVQDRHGRTALMYACLDHAGTEVVSVFLKHNSDVRIVDKKGSSALVYAINAGDPDVLRLLVDACKAQGKEVIIITTNKEIGSREPVTRQYLDVPPTLPQSPPYGVCVTPSEISLKHESQALKVTPSLTLKPPEDQVQNQDSFKKQSKELSAVVAHHHLERSASFEGSSTENDFSLHRTQPPPRSIPSPNEVSESKLASAVYQRRLGRRGSCASLTDEGSQSPRHRGNTSPSQTSIKSLSDLQLQIISTPDRTPSPPQQPPRRPLQRRQSAEAFNTATLQGLLPPSQPVRQKLTVTNSNPIEGLLEINTPRPNVIPMSTILSSRRCSLPGMPPPLRKCHTVHSINVSDLLENKPSLPATSCPNNLQSSHGDLMEETAEYDDEEEDTEGQTLKQAVSKGVLDGGPGGLIAMHRRQRCRERRGSAPFILEDELAQTRPGRLPPLKVSPSVPLPGIGRLKEPVVRSGPSSPSRMERVDRRHSMQPEDLRSLTSFAARSRGSFRNKHNSHSTESTDSI
ncbi:ankyrin repeat domain-containing protein 34C-like [Asterias amurensis]|uniref:ankyrin repeat domain-containing protein 34C-like n=1 Tax=Asterias amurensis TaxID=7602 RepID=UPI003AB3AA04